jgi:hypothetical protein
MGKCVRFRTNRHVSLAWSGMSISGEMTAPVFYYAQSGHREDYNLARTNRIDVKAKIVLLGYSSPSSAHSRHSQQQRKGGGSYRLQSATSPSDKRRQDIPPCAVGSGEPHSEGCDDGTISWCRGRPTQPAQQAFPGPSESRYAIGCRFPGFSRVEPTSEGSRARIVLDRELPCFELLRIQSAAFWQIRFLHPCHI